MASSALILPQKFQDIPDKDFTDAHAEQLAEEVPNIEVLDLSERPNLTDRGINALAAKCHFVREVNFSKTSHITPTSLLCFCAANKYLTKLTIRHCPLSLSLTDLKIILTICPMLRHFHACRQSVPPKIFNEIAPFMNHITHLTYPPPLLSSLKTYLEEGTFSTVLNHFPNLRTFPCTMLRINEFIAFAQAHPLIEECEYGHHITEGHVTEAISKWKNLRKFSWAASATVGDKGAEAIANSCPNLEELSLYNLSEITDRGLQALGQCKKLRLLNFSSNNLVSPKALLDLILGYPKLDDYNISHPLSITRAEVIEIRKMHRAFIGMSKPNPNISDLEFVEFSKSLKDGWRLSLAGCSRLTDASIPILIQNGSHLLQLNLESCRFSEKGIMTLIQALPHLEGLNLSFRNWDPNLSLSTQLLEIIAKSNPLLKTLDLSFSRPSEKGVLAITRSCSKLESLFLRGDAHITDHLIEEGLTHCPHLIEFSIGSPYITDAGMNRLLTTHPGLKTLIVGPCPQITRAFIETVTTEAKELKSLDLSRCPQIRESDALHIWKNCLSLERIFISEIPFENPNSPPPPYSPKLDQPFSPRAQITNGGPSAPPFEPFSPRNSLLPGRVTNGAPSAPPLRSMPLSPRNPLLPGRITSGAPSAPPPDYLFSPEKSPSAPPL